MSRLIDADALKGSLIEFTPYAVDPNFRNLNSDIDMFTVMDTIDEQPTIDPVKHGRWINFVGDFSTAECDKCGEIYEVSPDEKPCEEWFDVYKQFYNYCPSCGAKMDGEA